MNNKSEIIKETNRILKSVYSLLNEDYTIIKLNKMKRYCGIIEDNYDETIIIDPRMDILPTLLHEAIHKIYPLYSESKTKKLERQFKSNLTNRQWKNLLIKLSQKI